MSTEAIFMVQAIGVIGVGAFIGEFYRSVSNINIFTHGFFAAFLANAFISLLISYLLYYLTDNRPMSLIIGGLLSYQEESFLSKISKSVLKQFLENKEKE